MKRTNENIEELVRSVLKGFPRIKLAILFGSIRSARMRPDSDLDLGVAADEPLDAESKFRLAGDLAAVTGRPVDLIDLAMTSGPVLGEVLRGRVLVKDDSAIFARLIRKAWHWQADIAPTWREAAKARNTRVFG